MASTTMLKAALALVLLGGEVAGQASQSPLSDNSQAWFGVTEYESDGTTVIKEMSGHTGWTVTGTGANKTITYQLAVTIEQEGVQGETTPIDSGMFLAFPTTASTPVTPEWELDILFTSATDSSKKVHGYFQATGPITFQVGKIPSYSQKTQVQTMTYTRTQEGPLIPPEETADATTTDENAVEPHWKLNASKSSILPLTQTIVYERTDVESLGLQPGKQMTAQFSILSNSRTTTAFSKGVMLRWDYDTANQTAPEPEEDSAVANQVAALSATLLAASLLSVL